MSLGLIHGDKDFANPGNIKAVKQLVTYARENGPKITELDNILFNPRSEEQLRILQNNFWRAIDFLRAYLEFFDKTLSFVERTVASENKVAQAKIVSWRDTYRSIWKLYDDFCRKYVY